MVFTVQNRNWTKISNCGVLGPKCNICITSILFVVKEKGAESCKSRSWWEFCETAFSEHYRAIAYENSKMKRLLEQDLHTLKQSQFHCGYQKNSYILNTSRDAIGRWCSLGKRESVFFSYVYLGMLPLLQWITQCVWVHKQHELDSVSFKKMIWSWEGSVGCLGRRGRG